MTGVAPRGGPRLFLHIGRNKAGSTTLQDYFAAHADWLASLGINYALFGHACGTVPGLPNYPSHHDIMRHCQANPEQALLISNELIGGFTPDMAREMARDLAQFEPLVLAYVRPYRDWIRSSYAFDTRIGINGRDIDAYQRHIAPRVSFWPSLAPWGEILGWDRVRVRSVDTRDLAGGDLITDALTAIGLPAPPLQPAFSNRMPSWMAIEAMRLVTGKPDGNGWTQATLAMAATLEILIDEATSSCGLAGTPAVYLAQSQARDLADLYNGDLEKLSAASGTVLTPDNAGGAPCRPFLPEAARIPQPILRHVFNRAADADILAAQPETAAFIRARFAAYV
jgi:hypothetical protein